MATALENYRESGSWRPMAELPAGLIGAPIKIVGFHKDGSVDFAFHGRWSGMQTEEVRCSQLTVGAEPAPEDIVYQLVELFFQDGDKGYKVPLHSRLTLWQEA